MHHSLKEWRRIFKAKVHYLWNERSMFSFECCLILVFLCNSNIVVSSVNIELGEKCLVPQIFQGFSNIRQGVVVAYRPLIDFAVVHDDAFFF